MRLLLPISVSLLLALPAARAQMAPADDFFNGGAQLYISNNIPAALEKTEDGLKFYPNDAKLKKLEELLKQQQQSQSQPNQQNQQQQNQQQNQSRSQPQKSSGQQNQQQQNQSSKPPSQPEQQKQPAQNQPDQQKQPDQQSQKPAKSQDQEKSDESAQGAAPQTMSPEEAQRLLDTQKGDEQFLQMKPQNPSKPPIKDW